MWSDIEWTLASHIFYGLRRMGFGEGDSIPWRAIKSATDFMPYSFMVVDDADGVIVVISKLNLQDGDIVHIKTDNPDIERNFKRAISLFDCPRVLYIFGGDFNLEKVPFDIVAQFVDNKRNSEQDSDKAQ